MAKSKTYKTITRPYNEFLTRETSDSASSSFSSTPTASGDTSASNSSSSSSGSSSSANGSVEDMAVKSDGALGDVWIKNFIRSVGWRPKKSGFSIEGGTGHAEFSDIYVSGEIVAKSGEIGGFSIGDTELFAVSGLNKTSLSSLDVAFAAGPATYPNIKIYRAGTMEIGSLNPIIIDGVNTQIRSENYVSGAFGSGFMLSSNLLEVGNIACRGMFRTAVFQKDIINVIAGSFVITPNGDVLDVNMDASDASTLTIKGTVTLAVGDILRMKEVNGASVDDEWLLVTDIAGSPTYAVTRDLAGSYPTNGKPAWKKGVAVVDYGKSGQGGVYMTASDTNAPYISIFDHSGAPWSSIDTKMRMGNLNGFLGYTSNLYGIAIGDPTHFLKYDSTNGLRIQGDITITNPGNINTSALNNDAGWTAGATWGTNLYSIPATLSAPSGDGLYLSSTYMGFYKSSAWKTYIDNNGNLILGDIAGGHTGMSWNQSAGTLLIQGEVVATAGKIGTSTNYWSIGANGLTAVSASTDVIINYGKTDFGQDSTAGFILGYDYSATASKFEIGSSASKLFKYDGVDLSLTGGTITGGTIQTATSGDRTIIDSNNIRFYNGATQEGFMRPDSTYNMVIGTVGSCYVTDLNGVPNVEIKDDGSYYMAAEEGKLHWPSGRMLYSNGSAIQVNGDLIPHDDESHDCGYSNAKWNNIYAQKMWQQTNTDGSRHVYDFAYIEKGLIDKKLLDRVAKKNNHLENTNGYIPELKLRFKLGTVLKWYNKGLIESANENDFIVAVASDKGLPIVLGAEPVRVIGKTKIGDYIIASNTNGCARAADFKYAQGREIIGRCLENNNFIREKLVKVMIKF